MAPPLLPTTTAGPSSSSTSSKHFGLGLGLAPGRGGLGGLGGLGLGLAAGRGAGAGSGGRAYPLTSDADLGIGNASGRVPLVLRRLLKFSAMDFELAFWQLTYLVVSPRRVYKQTYHHKQTKNMWARDDPAMLLLITACVALTGATWAVLYHKSLIGTFAVILTMVFRDFILLSLLTACVLWFISNRLLVSSSTPYAAVSDNRVELAYAFDVAVNSFFPAFLTTAVALLPLAALVVRDNWVCLWLGNTLFLVAGMQYVYITYLGYAALPFVARSEVFLATLLPLLGGYLLSLLGFNITAHALELYFGQPW